MNLIMLSNLSVAYSPFLARWIYDILTCFEPCLLYRTEQIRGWAI